MTLGELVKNIGTLAVIGGVIIYLAKIYAQIKLTQEQMSNNDKLTRANLKATKVMLDHFIEDKIGNGEFRDARKDIDEALIERRVS
jgi:hypothetical protein